MSKVVWSADKGWHEDGLEVDLTVDRGRIHSTPATGYKVEALHTPTGLPVWTVVQYVDGVAKGGDHHWLNEGMAYRAANAYVRGIAKHGDTETTVLRKLGVTR